MTAFILLVMLPDVGIAGEECEASMLERRDENV